MAYTRGNYGIEYIESRPGDSSSGKGWIVLAVVVIAAASFTLTWMKRRGGETSAAQTSPVVAALSEPLPQIVRQEAPVAVLPEPEEPTVVSVNTQKVVEASRTDEFTRRPAVLRNLLMRLDEAGKTGSIELQVSTIERIRSLPGNPAADIDDKLARRLGELNRIWLFEKKNAQWTTEVRVKPGDKAARIAREHGSTLASMVKLNGWTDAEKIRSGSTVRVMNNPRFSLQVMRRTRIADLKLNGKFFCRYDLDAPVKAEVGTYETPENLRRFLHEKGVVFTADDRRELEMLLPKGSSLIIAEF